MNSLESLRSNGLALAGSAVKLHLGCGEIRLDGYINIDYPPAEHTVQQAVAADVFADIGELSFPEGSVDEVRLHHVFEHFDRPRALAMLCVWHQWLRVGGTLTIETPDVEQGARLLLSERHTYEQKQVVVRHLFGSHEARWAYHYDGWYPQRFVTTLSALGLGDVKVETSEARLLCNVTARAQKTRALTMRQLREIAMSLLRLSLVDASPSELHMHAIWTAHFDEAIARAGFSVNN